ncbi:hypothetical protein D3C81_1245310 [compost metagenome]
MNILKFALVEVQHLRYLFEQINCLHNQIIEIKGVIASETLLVHGIHFSHNTLEIISDLLLIHLRTYQLILGVADHGLNGFRFKLLGIDVKLLHAITDDRQLVSRVQDREV